MSTRRFLIVHSEDYLNPRKPVTMAQRQVIQLAQSIAAAGHSVIIAARLPDGETQDGGVFYWSIGEVFDLEPVLTRACSFGDFSLLAVDRMIPLEASRRFAKIVSRHLLAMDSEQGSIGVSWSAFPHYVDSVICFSGGIQEQILAQGIGSSIVHQLDSGSTTVVGEIMRIIEQSKAKTTDRTRTVVGVVTTWNQQCGLATYARYLFSRFPNDHFVVFAEDAPREVGLIDEANVVRSWQRRGDDLRILESQIVERGIKLIHLNFHDHSFIDHQFLIPFLKRLKERGIFIVTHLHTTYAADPRFSTFVMHVDHCIVHSAESRLQVIAVGAASHSVSVLPHGVLNLTRPQSADRTRIRGKYMPDQRAHLITSFGFIQPNKGIESVIEAVAHLHSRGIAAFGYLAGKVNDSHAQSVQYGLQLRELAQRYGIADRIRFSDRFLSEEEVSECLSVADLVFMNYTSQYYEASGACSRAVGAGALVATSLSPNFNPFADAVWHLTSGFPAGVSAELLLGNKELADTIRENLNRYRAENDWENISLRLRRIYQSLNFELGPEVSHLSVNGAKNTQPIGSIESQIERAEDQLRKGLPREARETLLTILETCPENERALRALGTLELSEQDTVKARDLFLKALRLQPSNPKTLSGLAMTALADGKLNEAHDYLLKSAAYDPEFSLGLKNLIFTGFALERYEETERAIRGYLATHPENNDIQYCLAGCLFKKGDHPAARRVLESIIERDPSHTNALELISVLDAEIDQSRISKQSAAIDLALAEIESAKSLRQLDIVYARLDELEKLPVSTEQFSKIFVIRGEALCMDAKFDRAEELFRQVLEVEPNHGRALCGLGTVALSREQLTKAQDYFERALACHDRADLALTGLGVCAQWLSKPDQAWDYFQRAIALYPENEQALFGVVQIGMLRREFSIVERALRGFLECRPAHVEQLYSLAGCLYAQRRYREALDEIDRVLLFEPEHVNSLELRSIISGRIDEEGRGHGVR